MILFLLQTACHIASQPTSFFLSERRLPYSLPANIFLPIWQRGQPAALDVTVISTLQQCTVYHSRLATIRQHFLPSLTGQNPFNDQYRDLLALPARLGGLGITNPSKQTTSHFDASKKITTPLVALITQQSHSYPLEAKAKQARAKRNIHILHRQQDETAAADLKSTLSSKPKRAMEASSEKGASSWLSTLPIAEHGFALHKGEFRDALCLRYGWRPPRLPSHCICSNQFTVQHAINCPRGGFPSIRHNEIRDITADLMSEVCHGVGKEPSLQPVTEERLTHRTANREDGARLDIVAESFWGRDR